MEQIKQWAVNICITLVVTGVLSMLIPHGSMEKVMKFATSVFFLCCLLLPFFTGLPELKLDTEAAAAADYADIEETMQKQFGMLSKSNIERIVQNILEAEEITAEKIEADIHISEDNSVSINKVCVVLSERDSGRREEVRELLRQQTGLAIEVSGAADEEKDGSANG